MKHLIVKIKADKKLVLAKFNNPNTAKKVFTALNVRKHKQQIELLLNKSSAYYEENASTFIQ